MANKDKLTLLLVEDNHSHAELVKRTYSNHEMIHSIHHVSDGEEALDYLFQRNTFTHLPLGHQPDVIILDLRLPKIDGLSVLKEIKESDSLRNIPVVILTSSEAEKDIAVSCQYRANNYLVKPMDFSQFTQLNDVLGFYWLGRNVASNNDTTT